jgi:hypothetical protein
MYPFVSAYGIPIEILKECCIKEATVIGISDREHVCILCDGTEYSNVPVWIHTDIGTRTAMLSNTECSPEQCFKDSALIFTVGVDAEISRVSASNGTHSSLGSITENPRVLVIKSTDSVLAVIRVLSKINHENPNSVCIPTYKMVALVNTGNLYMSLFDITNNCELVAMTYNSFKIPSLPEINYSSIEYANKHLIYNYLATGFKITSNNALYVEQQYGCIPAVFVAFGGLSENVCYNTDGSQEGPPTSWDFIYSGGSNYSGTCRCGFATGTGQNLYISEEDPWWFNDTTSSVIGITASRLFSALIKSSGGYLAPSVATSSAILMREGSTKFLKRNVLCEASGFDPDISTAVITISVFNGFEFILYSTQELSGYSYPTGNSLMHNGITISYNDLTVSSNFVYSAFYVPYIYAIVEVFSDGTNTSRTLMEPTDEMRGMAEINSDIQTLTAGYVLDSYKMNWKGLVDYFEDTNWSIYSTYKTPTVTVSYYFIPFSLLEYKLKNGL